jgi:predicted glycoside hydrolase/deacetylase ChbG (UPF0249 family)
MDTDAQTHTRALIQTSGNTPRHMDTHGHTVMDRDAQTHTRALIQTSGNTPRHMDTDSHGHTYTQTHGQAELQLVVTQSYCNCNTS